ncbi:MAG: RusA family crossover junction endodeoxyribonuclease [Planctomycetes bacterium]|nr:RusA family crossover junction endodeoxyribonuclease [Planctomycetota bacterium]
MQRGGHTRSFAFEVDFVPNSSKNRKRIAWKQQRVCPLCKRGTPYIKTEKHVTSEMEAIGYLAQAARAPLFADDELAMDVKIHVPRQRTRIELVSLGPRPPKRIASGRQKDTDNTLSTICDALNKVVYRDDSQIRRHCIERFPEGFE